MGAHRLYMYCEVDYHLGLARSCRVWYMSQPGALWDERHVLLERPSLAENRASCPDLIPDHECSRLMVKLVWPIGEGLAHCQQVYYCMP